MSTNTEWRPIARWPGYEINRKGDVRSLKTNRILRRFPHPTSGPSLPCVSGTHGSAQVNVLLEQAFGPGAAKAAGLPAPDMGRVKRHAPGYLRQRQGCAASRRCTDCGRPTDNYRCDDCWLARRGYAPADAPHTHCDL